MRIFFSFLIITLVYSCSGNKEGEKTSPAKINSLLLSNETRLCDTCSSYLLISHDECTECADLRVDGGIVYISHSFYKTCDSLINTDTLLTKNPHTHGQIALRTRYMKINSEKAFNKLWPKRIKFWPDTAIVYESFDKKYLVKGKVIDFSIDKKMGFNEIIPIFQIDNYTLFKK